MSGLKPTQRIFVSHTYSDGVFCSQVVADLRRALGGEETAVCYDASGGLQEGDAWRREIEAEITARPIFVVVLSPDAVASRWVNGEIDLAWQQKNTLAGKRIIPLLPHICDVPARLRSLHAVSFVASRPYEDALAELLGALNEPSTVVSTLSTMVRGEATSWPPHVAWSAGAPTRRHSGYRHMLLGMLALMIGFYAISFSLALIVSRLSHDAESALTQPLAGSDVFLLGGLNWYTIINLALLIVLYLALLRLNILPRDPFGARQRARELALRREADTRDLE
jgi:hypothetical protein